MFQSAIGGLTRDNKILYLNLGLILVVVYPKVKTPEGA